MNRLVFKQQKQLRGFSLVELMVVISIMLVLVGLTVNLTKGSLSSLELTTTANEIATLLNRAKEEALVRNTNVQVRIYQSENQFGETAYNLISIGFVEAPEDLSSVDSEDPDPDSFKFVPLTRRFIMPSSAQLMEDAPYSTIIADAPLEGSEADDALGQLPYKAFGFDPSNRVSLDVDQQWTLTLIESGRDISDLPSNFVTLQIFPSTGRINQIQPY